MVDVLFCFKIQVPWVWLQFYAGCRSPLVPSLHFFMDQQLPAQVVQSRWQELKEPSNTSNGLCGFQFTNIPTAKERNLKASQSMDQDIYSTCSTVAPAEDGICHHYREGWRTEMIFQPIQPLRSCETWSSHCNSSFLISKLRHNNNLCLLKMEDQKQERQRW